VVCLYRLKGCEPFIADQHIVTQLHKHQSGETRVTLINHAYLSAENQKNLTHLARHVVLQTITPSRLSRALGGLSAATDGPDSATIVWKRSFVLAGQIVLWPFGKALAQHEPDVVHVEYAPWSPQSIQALVFARAFAPKAKLVLTMKKNTYMPKAFLIEQAKTAVRRAVDRRVAAYLAESALAKQLCVEWLGIAPERIHLCQQLGVDLDIFVPCAAPRPEGRLIVGYVGQLHARKGVNELVEAVRELANAGLDIEARLLGDGPLRAPLLELAKRVPWLSIHGPVPHRQVAPFLQGCDVFVFASRNEPDHQEHDAHALMEAMAVGLPAVTTKSGIIPEQVDAESALMVREGCHHDLAAKLQLLASNRDLRLAMGRRAHQLATERFGLEVLAKKRARIYEEVARG